MPKTTLTFAKSPYKRWANADARKTAERLEALGFSDIGPLKVAQMAWVQGQAFIHAKERAYAVMLVDSGRPTWVDIFSLHPGTESGCYGVTNAVAPLLGAVADLPTYFACRALPKVPVDLLLAEFVKGRPAGAQPVSAGNLILAYEVMVAADEAWTVKSTPPVKGRPTKASTRAAGEAVKVKMDEVVREAWRQAKEVMRIRPLSELRQLLIGLRYPEKREYSLPSTLTAAVSKGNLELAQVFLDRGADLNGETVGFNSALDAAASRGQLKAVEFLIERGAKPKPAIVPSLSCLMTSLTKRHYRIAKRLLAAGVPPAEIKAAKTAYKTAPAEVQSLLAGKDVTDDRLATLEQQGKDHAPKLKPLKGAFLLMGEEPEYPPLAGAEREQALKRALVLLALPEVRKGLNSVSADETDLVELAVKTEIPELASTFLKSGANAETKSSALATACGLGSKELTALALREGANPNLVTGERTPALFIAVNYGDPLMVKLLLDAGADAKIRHQGQFAKARVNGPFKEEIMEMLEQKAPKPPAEKGSALKILKAKRGFNGTTTRGVKEFQDGIGHPEWAVGMVEAPAAEVAAAYATLHPQAKWFADTAAKAVYAEPAVHFLFQLQGQSWTNLICSVGWLSSEALKGFPADLTALSKSLRCRAVLYISEDTSGYEGYEIFDQGQKAESADRFDLGEFTSTFRAKPKGMAKDFPDAALAPLGIYLPYTYPDFDGDSVKLTLTGVALEAVARVDAFKL